MVTYGIMTETMESDDETPPQISLTPRRIKMTPEERRFKRQQKTKRNTQSSKNSNTRNVQKQAEDKFQSLLNRNEDELLEFVAQVNSVYQDTLKKEAPFMTFVFCGMQSAGKSTIMERFLNAALNIVQEGTGTRCPLDTTCIHDASLDPPSCRLSGDELEEGQSGSNLSVQEVFERITQHNQKLAGEDRFSTQPLRLIFRSCNVQNMRFVDTPGIISTKGTGLDNREDIKRILRSEMQKANSKLCVLVDPREFATNPIVDFCDETFGARENWISDATFLMTKFDMKTNDSRTANKANTFFSEFVDNKCFPFLVITPTLENEKLPPGDPYQKRIELLEKADAYEKRQFSHWFEQHERYRNAHDDAEVLIDDIAHRIGFDRAKSTMRQVMLKDTLERLPEVIASLRKDLEVREAEHKVLTQRIQLNDPNNVKNTVNRMLYEVQRRIQSYLDGNLEVAMKFGGRLQTLEDEIIEEEDSDWVDKELNFHSEKEDNWRENIANMDEYPDEIQPDNAFLGGKQYQRAINFFRAVMIESLPDPYQLQELVPTACGYLAGALQNENWENAMVKITQACLRDVSHPGINYLIKHIGCVFRRLFDIALDDVREGEQFSSEFQLVPDSVDRFLRQTFDEMLWNLMVDCADKTHSFLEPMYSTIDPTLPTFPRRQFKKESLTKTDEEGDEPCENALVSWMKSLRNAGSNAKEAKEILREESKQRAHRKQVFLPDERATMITKEETEIILQMSFDYMVGLVEFNLILLKFQLNHHLYETFKTGVGYHLLRKVNDADWETLVQKDVTLEERCKVVKEQVDGIRNSLRDVQKMQRNVA